MPELERREPELEQRAKILVMGRKQTQFWVRALDLTKEVDFAISLINDRMKAQRKWGVAPVVAEYDMGDGTMLVYFLSIEVDALGIRNGGGVIYCVSKKHLKEALKLRDRLADELLKERAKGFDEFVEMPTKKEL
jgi:hypothetical protein